MDLNKEISAILTSVVLISFFIISIWLYRYFKAKKKAKADSGVTIDSSTKKKINKHLAIMKVQINDSKKIF